MQRKLWVSILSATALLAGIGLFIFIIISVIRSSSYDHCENAVVPSYITIRKGYENIFVSWYEPWPNEECNAYYKLQYSIDSGKKEEAHITGTSYALPVIPVCSLLHIEVWALTEAGKQTNYSITETYLEPPSTGGATDIKFSPSEEGLEITWIRPTTQENCDLYYDIEVSFDKIGSEIYHTQISTENITIPHNMYCFLLTFFISSYIHEEYISNSYAVEIYISDEEVKDIQVKQSLENPNQMIVTWAKHSKHEYCTLMYDVQSSDDNGYEEEVQVQDATAIFTAYFCAPFNITITAFSELISYRFPIAKTTLMLDPTHINEVTELNLLQEESEQLITWEAIPNLNHCDVTYKLDFITDLGTTPFTTNETFFGVPQESYCFSLQFQVQAVVAEVTSQAIKSIIYTYAQAVTGLEHMISPEDSNKLIVSWDGHPKEVLCSLEYSVAYSTEDEDVETITTTDHEATFDINYCVNANVSVTAYRYSTLHNDAATINATECNEI